MDRRPTKHLDAEPIIGNTMRQAAVSLRRIARRECVCRPAPAPQGICDICQARRALAAIEFLPASFRARFGIVRTPACDARPGQAMRRAVLVENGRFANAVTGSAQPSRLQSDLLRALDCIERAGLRCDPQDAEEGLI